MKKKYILATIHTDDPELNTCLEDVQTVTDLTIETLLAELANLHHSHQITPENVQALAQRLYIDALVHKQFKNDDHEVIVCLITDTLLRLNAQLHRVMRHRDEKELWGVESYRNTDLVMERRPKHGLLRPHSLTDFSRPTFP